VSAPISGPKAQHIKLQMIKTKNRTALITATLDCIAEIGFANATVSEIIKRAGLSRGMIHLHFKNKEGLVLAASHYASQEYRERLQHFVQQAQSSPQAQIAAIIKHDLNTEVLNAKSVRVWYELRGASCFHPELARYSDTRDERLRQLFLNAFRSISKSNRYTNQELLTEDYTVVCLAMMEGMWNDYLMHQKSFQRDTAERAIFRVLSSLFPQHFDLYGALDG